MRKQKAFTLIELLVVIAIIALLLSILMPSLQKVKQQAQAVVDRANLKTLNLAYTMYTEDHDNKIWRGFYWPASASSCHTFTEHNWWMPAMQLYAGDIGKVRFCPAAKKLRFLEDGVAYGLGWRKEPFTAWGHSPWLRENSPVKDSDYGSYAVNAWIEDSWNDCNADSEKFWRRSNKIGQAETVPFLVDAQWLDCWPEPSNPPPPTENYYWRDGGGQMARIVQNRHNKQENVIFMDGSSRLIGLKGLYTLKWHREYNTRGIWTTIGGATPTSWPDWMRGFEDY